MMRQDHWVPLRRTIEHIFGYPPGTCDPITPADWAINLAILQDIHRLNQFYTTQAVKDWDRTGQGCFAVFVQAYVAECWRYITRSN